MKNLLVILIWLISLADFSQSIVWEKAYNKSQYDHFGCIRATRDGGCIWGGDYQSDYYADSILSGRVYHKVKGAEIWIMKLSPNGDMEWEKSSGDENDDCFMDMQQTTDGGYIILSGKSEIDKAKNKDSIYLKSNWKSSVSLTKINPTGIVEWEKDFPVSWEFIKTLDLASDGGYIIGGYAYVYDEKLAPKTFKTIQARTEFFETKSDIVVYKVDSKGEIQWRKIYGGPNDDRLTCIRQLPDRGYLLGGSSYSIDTDKKNGKTKRTDDLLIKIDSKGKQQWTKSYSDSSPATVIDIKLSPHGGYIIGEGVSRSGRMSDFCVVKVDSKFRLQWKKYYGGTQGDALSSLIPCGDGSFVLAGITHSTDGNVKSGYKGNWDYWLVKINAQGDIIWERTLGSPEKERLVNAQRSFDGAYYLGGTTGHLVGPLDGDISRNYPPEKVTIQGNDVKSPTRPKVANIWIVKVKE